MVYIPEHTNNGWIVEEVDETELRIMGHRRSVDNDMICRWKEGAGFYGLIYNSNTIFKTEEAAWKWIQKVYVPAEEYYTDFITVQEGLRR